MLSVVIISCKDDKACYLTVFALKAQLDRERMEYEIIVVADGGTEIKWENQGIRCLRVNTGSPQASRDAGIRAARYPHVLVVESHVVVSDVQMLLEQHRGLGAALTFPYRRAEGAEMFDVYGHETDWNGNLWHKRLIYRLASDRPYRVSQFGQSCFMLDRDWYFSSGGYTKLMAGWGGEEPFLCLKAWMLGRECWLVPSVWQAHYLTSGGSDRTTTAEFKRNMDVLAYVIIGRRNNGFIPSPEVEAERRRICGGPFKGDANLLREHLKKIGAVA